MLTTKTNVTPTLKAKEQSKRKEISARECTSMLASLTSVCKSQHHRIISQLVGWLVEEVKIYVP